MNVDRLIATLKETEHLDATAIAEALWLATQMQGGEAIPASFAEPEEQTATEQPPIETPAEPDIQPPKPVSETTAEVATPSVTDTSSILPTEALALSPAEGLALSPAEGLPIWIADPPLLDNSLAIIRALRPLLQQVPSGISEEINEAATVERIVETNIWLPVLEPNREPWFDVVLLIDRNASMNLWRRLVDDLQLTLKRYRAFRNLQVFNIDADADTIRLLPHPQGLPRSPREFLSPDGRRLAIVASDCVADYWWNGLMLSVLSEWGKTMPTVVWQMLPEWMWERTALGMGEYVALRNQTPGAANGQLASEVLSLFEPEDMENRVAVPVVSSDVGELQAWSQVLAGNRQQVCGGFLLPANGDGLPASEPGDSDTATADATNDASQKIQQFRMLSSPKARQLAALLAASPVITLPVMRLIRASMLPATSPLPVAEVFLSGLLQKLPGQPPETDPELVQYDFVPGVRENLLDMLPPVDAVKVINDVSFYVAKRLGYSSRRQFKAWLLSPESEDREKAAGMKSFAKVTAKVLKRLGGEYAREAERLDPEAGEESEKETAKEPQLYTRQFQTATITVVRSFDFETATVEVKENDIQIHRRRQQAWFYSEPLGNNIELEMVYIRAGSFTMGGPESEERSRDSERPQHEVNVPAFFLGKYPVTQAQWRAVANLPKYERDLKIDPSYFSGDNRPVERVSWFDAVEFCQRLSQYTGRDYQLPSEAEWEYACRAGTQTPFYFGETITTELANYRGTRVYGRGKEGEYREKTTNVGSFPANEFGLFDMHGNAWEWCADDWHDNYKGAPTDGSAWIDNEDRTETIKLLRGGSWDVFPHFCRSAFRYRDRPDITDLISGFRVACAAARTL